MDLDTKKKLAKKVGFEVENFNSANVKNLKDKLQPSWVEQIEADQKHLEKRRERARRAVAKPPLTKNFAPPTKIAENTTELIEQCNDLIWGESIFRIYVSFMEL